MEILWLTARDFTNDLAKSTEIGVAEGLVARGHQVSIISPGELFSETVGHHGIKRWNFPGLKTISGARKINNLLKNNNGVLKGIDLILVDWRYVLPLRGFLTFTNTPWCLIDRGPPADIGFLKLLQKRYWRRAWEIADLHAIGGFTVSCAHTKFVRERNGVGLRISEIPAGSSRNKFLGKKTDPSDLLEIVYVGRLDKRRGVGEILRLSEILESSKFSYRINIYGSGDDVFRFKKYSRENEKLYFNGVVGRNEIPEILARSHIGIMPMPDITVWRISSPLKLAEYLAAGLMVIGPMHPGNHGDIVSKSIRLSEQRDWPITAVEEIRRAIDEGWGEIIEDSLQVSSDLSWETITTDLDNRILEFLS